MASGADKVVYTAATTEDVVFKVYHGAAARAMESLGAKPQEALCRVAREESSRYERLDVQAPEQLGVRYAKTSYLLVEGVPVEVQERVVCESRSMPEDLALRVRALGLTDLHPQNMGYDAAEERWILFDCLGSAVLDLYQDAEEGPEVK